MPLCNFAPQDRNYPAVEKFAYSNSEAPGLGSARRPELLDTPIESWTKNIDEPHSRHSTPGCPLAEMIHHSRMMAKGNGRKRGITDEEENNRSGGATDYGPGALSDGMGSHFHCTGIANVIPLEGFGRGSTPPPPMPSPDYWENLNRYGEYRLAQQRKEMQQHSHIFATYMSQHSPTVELQHTLERPLIPQHPHTPQSPQTPENPRTPLKRKFDNEESYPYDIEHWRVTQAGTGRNKSFHSPNLPSRSVLSHMALEPATIPPQHERPIRAVSGPSNTIQHQPPHRIVSDSAIEQALEAMSGPSTDRQQRHMSKHMSECALKQVQLARQATYAAVIETRSGRRTPLLVNAPNIWPITPTTVPTWPKSSLSVRHPEDELGQEAAPTSAYRSQIRTLNVRRKKGFTGLNAHRPDTEVSTTERGRKASSGSHRSTQPSRQPSRQPSTDSPSSRNSKFTEELDLDGPSVFASHPSTSNDSYFQSPVLASSSLSPARENDADKDEDENDKDATAKQKRRTKLKHTLKKLWNQVKTLNEKVVSNFKCNCGKMSKLCRKHKAVIYELPGSAIGDE